MTRVDLHALAAVNDLEDYHQRTVSAITDIIYKANIKEFYTPLEFSKVTAIKYTTVINFCHKGQLKATQVVASGSWIIHRDEVDRLIQQAGENKSIYGDNKVFRNTKNSNKNGGTIV